MEILHQMWRDDVNSRDADSPSELARESTREARKRLRSIAAVADQRTARADEQRSTAIWRVRQRHPGRAPGWPVDPRSRFWQPDELVLNPDRGSGQGWRRLRRLNRRGGRGLRRSSGDGRMEHQHGKREQWHHSGTIHTPGHKPEPCRRRCRKSPAGSPGRMAAVMLFSPMCTQTPHLCPFPRVRLLESTCRSAPASSSPSCCCQWCR